MASPCTSCSRTSRFPLNRACTEETALRREKPYASQESARNISSDSPLCRRASALQIPASRTISFVARLIWRRYAHTTHQRNESRFLNPCAAGPSMSWHMCAASGPRVKGAASASKSQPCSAARNSASHLARSSRSHHCMNFRWAAIDPLAAGPSLTHTASGGIFFCRVRQLATLSIHKRKQ